MSKKEKSPQIGHSQDRLYKDRRFKPKFHCKPGTSVCTNCRAVCHEKHWFIEPDKYERLLEDTSVNQTLCPGCQRIEQNVHNGEVILKGPLLLANKDAVMGLIRHTETKAWHDNPSSRISSLVDSGESIEIQTTTKWLATRIGKEMQKCFKGTLNIKPSPREKFVRVQWSRK